MGMQRRADLLRSGRSVEPIAERKKKVKRSAIIPLERNNDLIREEKTSSMSAKALVQQWEALFARLICLPVCMGTPVAEQRNVDNLSKKGPIGSVCCSRIYWCRLILLLCSPSLVSKERLEQFDEDESEYQELEDCLPMVHDRRMIRILLTLNVILQRMVAGSFDVELLARPHETKEEVATSTSSSYLSAE